MKASQKKVSANLFFYVSLVFPLITFSYYNIEISFFNVCKVKYEKGQCINGSSYSDKVIQASFFLKLLKNI